MSQCLTSCFTNLFTDSAGLWRALDLLAGRRPTSHSTISQGICVTTYRRFRNMASQACSCLLRKLLGVLHKVFAGGHVRLLGGVATRTFPVLKSTYIRRRKAGSSPF